MHELVHVQQECDFANYDKFLVKTVEGKKHVECGKCLCKEIQAMKFSRICSGKNPIDEKQCIIDRAISNCNQAGQDCYDKGDNKEMEKFISETKNAKGEVTSNDLFDKCSK